MLGENTMPPVFVDAHGLAERLDVSYETVLTWVRRGKVPHIRDGRGRVMFNLNSVIEALREKPLQPEAARPEGVA
jgi:excisionase family DNA binding protein